ncbi:MAG: asparagine synthetase B [Bacteroidales bacterium]|nr:asparagine synthetase B [Bacteroidales bacterium]
MKRFFVIVLFLICSLSGNCAYMLIAMDESQTDHLKSYGIAYWAIDRGYESWWLLNYRGGSFLIYFNSELERECILRNVSYEVIADAQKNSIINDISAPSVNQDAVKLEKAPKIAVYTPPISQPWDDAVTLALTYAEIPYDKIYDTEIIEGKLVEYDWLHLHHEDFTGQYGKFYASYSRMQWYKDRQRLSEQDAQNLGFSKVSKLKLAVVLAIKQYVFNGGFLFAMCAATDTFDIALAAAETDICEYMFDGDGMDPNAQSNLNFDNCLAFENFNLKLNPYEYEFSDIDVSTSRRSNTNDDYFTLFEFSAKWDPVPTMLCQNHATLIHGFMGQTTAFKSEYVKPNVLIMGENKSLSEARYIHGEYGNGMWTFYGGHDPEDYRHYVGDEKTDLSLYPNSPGYRLILNNVLFPAAKKKKQKT